MEVTLNFKELRKTQRRYKKYLNINIKFNDYIDYISMYLLLQEINRKEKDIQVKEIIVNLWEQRKLKRIMRNDRQNNKRRL